MTLMLIKAQPRPFSPTIRISGIPETWSKEQLCKILKSLYEEDPHDIEAVGGAKNAVRIISLTSAPMDPEYKMATAEITLLPRQLHELTTATPNGIYLDVVDAVGNDETELRFDTGFMGLTTLHTPDSPAVE